MIISKKFLSNQGELNKNVINWAIEIKSELALLDRELKIDIDKSNENNVFYIDDITPEEIQAGTLAVFNYCKINNCLNLYYDYILSIAKNDNEKLVALKENKKLEINEARDNAILQGFTFEGKTYQADKKSIDAMSNTAQTERTDIKWIASDDTIVSFTNDKFKDLQSAITKFIQDNVIKARELKNQVILARNIEDLDKIKW